MEVQELGFINDVIQDARADARTEQKYDILIDAIFRNIKLNWNNDGLALKSDEKILNIIEALELERYTSALHKLQKEMQKENEK